MKAEHTSDEHPVSDPLKEHIDAPAQEVRSGAEHLPHCSGWVFDYGGPFDCPGAPACEACPLEAGVVPALPTGEVIAE